MRHAALALLLFVTPALAEPPAPMDHRAKILFVEMRRGPAEDLAPFLAADAPPLSRQLAIRALGRIGDRGKAPEMLAKLLETEKTQLALVLWAAGIAQAESLAEPIAKHLGSEDPLIAAAAAEALGWTGAKGVDGQIAAMLHHPDTHVRAGALRGLARIRPEAMLERLVRFLDAEDPTEREAAEYAVWKTAEERGRAARAKNPEWWRESLLSADIMLGHRESEPERLLMLIRTLAGLHPGWVSLDLLDAKDARVVQETLRRSARTVDEQDTVKLERLTDALDHEDAEVRRLAAETLGREEWPLPLRVRALKSRFAREKDLRVRDVLAIELSRCGDESAWKSIAKDPARKEIEEVTRLLAEARVLLVSKREKAFAELCSFLTPDWDDPLPSAVLVRMLWEIGKRDDPALESLLREITLGFGQDGRDHVRAAAFGLMVENRMYTIEMRGKKARLRGLVPEVLRYWFPMSSPTSVGPEVKQALLRALAELPEDEQAMKHFGGIAERFIRSYLEAGDSSIWARLAARESGVALGLKNLPDEDDLPANDWKGLPRPNKPVLGLDLSGESPWLTEEEILRIADRIAETKARILIETSVGDMTVALLPEQAPVHCASLVLSALRGTYVNTRWHRVVPSFVIQGGDPRGHGAGNAGFTIPDEISPIRYRRGDLGMPKSRKDDGGCQLFFMHCAYPRLDERYTLYGRVAEGFEVLDRVRVGDLIRVVRVVR